MDTSTRFWSKVIKGPGPGDCWLWVGAIGDDGYGRFWTKSPTGKQRMIRGHRYTLALIHGGLEAIEGVLGCHVCDNPICVRAEAGETSHLYLGSPGSNMADRVNRGRHNWQAAAQFFRRETRDQRATKARALRTLVLDRGYDHDAIKALLLGLATEQGTLF